VLRLITAQRHVLCKRTWSGPSACPIFFVSAIRPLPLLAMTRSAISPSARRE
jgi:hypothetical protein